MGKQRVLTGNLAHRQMSSAYGRSSYFGCVYIHKQAFEIIRLTRAKSYFNLVLCERRRKRAFSIQLWVDYIFSDRIHSLYQRITVLVKKVLLCPIDKLMAFGIIPLYFISFYGCVNLAIKTILLDFITTAAVCFRFQIVHMRQLPG